MILFLDPQPPQMIEISVDPETEVRPSNDEGSMASFGTPSFASESIISTTEEYAGPYRIYGL